MNIPVFDIRVLFKAISLGWTTHAYCLFYYDHFSSKCLNYTEKDVVKKRCPFFSHYFLQCRPTLEEIMGKLREQICIFLKLRIIIGKMGKYFPILTIKKLILRKILFFPQNLRIFSEFFHDLSSVCHA